MVWKEADERAEAEAARAAIVEEEKRRAEVEVWKNATAAFDSEDEDGGEVGGGDYVTDAGSPTDAKTDDLLGGRREMPRPDRVDDHKVAKAAGKVMGAKPHLVRPPFLFYFILYKIN